MLRQYEALLLTVPEITKDEEKSIEKDVSRFVVQDKGSVISFERWGKFKLAYPVKKNEYGVYFLIRFEVPAGSTVLEEVRTFFAVKLHNIVMRNVFSKLDPRRPFTYNRPKSLEEAPAAGGRDVDAFLKENKMEGLLSSGQSAPEDKVSEKKDFVDAADRTEKD